MIEQQYYGTEIHKDIIRSAVDDHMKIFSASFSLMKFFWISIRNITEVCSLGSN